MNREAARADLRAVELLRDWPDETIAEAARLLSSVTTRKAGVYRFERFLDARDPWHSSDPRGAGYPGQIVRGVPRISRAAQRRDWICRHQPIDPDDPVERLLAEVRGTYA